MSTCHTLKGIALLVRLPRNTPMLRRISAAAAGLALALLSLSFPNSKEATAAPPVRSALADPMRLLAQYERWKSSQRPDGSLSLQLVAPSSHAQPSSGPTGRVEVDIAREHIFATVMGWNAEAPPVLWMSADGEPAPDRPIGTFDRSRSSPDTWVLRSELEDAHTTTWRIARLLVASEGEVPAAARLVATPSLFQRVYASEHLRQRSAPGLALVGSALAEEPASLADLFTDLLAEGENIFFRETFAGNGRTCGTCHPAQNNFTLDAAFIAGLRADDPLFVAELVPALKFGDPQNLDARGRPRRFENPALLRRFGLILENVDGRGDLENRFAMRAVTHTIGMSVSITSPLGSAQTPRDRTGWAGDGAPSGMVGGILTTGSLRDFALGAIQQHFPKTLARSFAGPNPDFRLPTARELDAIEAFTLAIGRQQELELQDGLPNTLRLRDPGAEAGRILFRDGSPAGSFSCNGCHENAGANVKVNGVPVNLNFNTGVELFLQNRIADPSLTIPGEPRPVDGGFGLDPAGGFDVLQAQPGSINENFGNREFNTTSVVEAADTAPFFHNNIVSTLEDTVRFYNSPEFIASIGVGIPLNERQVAQVSNFMRAINALDNIESSSLRLSRRALQALRQSPVRNDVVGRALEIAVADTNDAILVLRQGQLHSTGPFQNNAVQQLEAGREALRAAQRSSTAPLLRALLITHATLRFERAIAIVRF